MDKEDKGEPRILTQADETVKPGDTRLNDSELDEAELDKVSGGGMLSSAVANVIKNMGDAISKAARNG